MKICLWKIKKALKNLKKIIAKLKNYLKNVLNFFSLHNIKLYKQSINIV